MTTTEQGSLFEPTENLSVAVECNLESSQETETTVVTAVEKKEVLTSVDNQQVPRAVKRYTVTGEELLNRPFEQQPYLVEGLIHRGCLIGLTGSSETGKSTFARDFCMAIATKQEHYLGRSLNVKHGNIIYVSSEDNQEMMQDYLRNRVKDGHPSLLRGFRLMDDCAEHQKKLIEELKREPADLIVIDVFADLFSGDINSTVHVRNFLNDYQRIADAYKATILILHHTGKRTERLAPSKNNTLGSQGFESKMRLCFELRMDHENNSRRHLCIVKGNYLKPEEKRTSLLLNLNEDRSYSYVGDGVDLERLVVPDGRNRLDDEDEQEIIRLHKEGKSYRMIEQIMKEQGVNVGKTKVGEIVSKHSSKVENGILTIKPLSQN